MANELISQQNSRVTVMIDGSRVGTWDTKSGGGTNVTVPKHRSGGMGAQRTVAVLAEYDDLTLSRGFERPADVEFVRRFKPRSGRARMTATEEFLDADGNVFGRGITYTGRLANVNDGDADANSTDVRMLEITMAVEAMA